MTVARLSSPSARVDLLAGARSWETAGGVRPLPHPAHLRSTAQHPNPHMEVSA